ncbi:MAG: cellulase family glycosylhydrolase [Anaerolineales bacterium]
MIPRRSYPWRFFVLGGGLFLLLTACALPAAQADPLPATSMPTATATPSPIATSTATSTPAGTPTATPTPLPTIDIPMLTRTATPTPAPPTPLPALWHLPEPVVPEPFGAQIHFINPDYREVAQLAATGIRFVRMDLFWHEVEREKGRYDFSGYDALVAAFAAHDMRIVFILDYGNALYDGGHSPHSDGGRAAFARFAAAAARRYRGRGVIWEIWNEPNLAHFWYPEPRAHHYGLLAMRAAAAIRRADPTALVIAPALCGYEWAYWETLGEMGLFQHVDAVSVHSYGVEQPEELLGPYLQLRALIDAHNPAWKIPILSSEWGFPSVEHGITQYQQAQYLARQWLFNLAHDIHLNIWYDWRDDGLDPWDPEHHFGMVHHDFSPKPAYAAAQTLAQTLHGYRFLRRIPLARAEDYALLFKKGNALALVVWTSAETPREVALPLPMSEIPVVEMTGETSTLAGDGRLLRVALTQSPRYLLLGRDPALEAVGSWRPYETLHAFSVEQEPEDASVRVVVRHDFAMPMEIEMQVWALGEVRGEITATVSPGESQSYRIPLALAPDDEALRGDLPAEIVFRVLDEDLASIDEALAPLQRGVIWLQIRGAEEAEE